jgi:hypothetical protein
MLHLHRHQPGKHFHHFAAMRTVKTRGSLYRGCLGPGWGHLQPARWSMFWYLGIPEVATDLNNVLVTARNGSDDGYV